MHFLLQVFSLILENIIPDGNVPASSEAIQLKQDDECFRSLMELS